MLYDNYSAAVRALSWLKVGIPLNDLAYTWVRASSHTFADCSRYECFPKEYLQYFEFLLFIFLLGSLLLLLIDRGRRNAAVFVGSLIVAFLIPLVAADLLYGGFRSAIERYYYLIRVGYLLGVSLAIFRVMLWRRSVGLTLLFLLLGVQVYSEYMYLRSNHPRWNTKLFVELRNASRKYPKTLVVAPTFPPECGNALAMSLLFKEQNVDFVFFDAADPNSRERVYNTAHNYTHMIPFGRISEVLQLQNESCYRKVAHFESAFYQTDIVRVKGEGCKL